MGEVQRNFTYALNCVLRHLTKSQQFFRNLENEEEVSKTPERTFTKIKTEGAHSNLNPATHYMLLTAQTDLIGKYFGTQDFSVDSSLIIPIDNLLSERLDNLETSTNENMHP